MSPTIDDLGQLDGLRYIVVSIEADIHTDMRRIARHWFDVVPSLEKLMLRMVGHGRSPRTWIWARELGEEFRTIEAWDPEEAFREAAP